MKIFILGLLLLSCAPITSYYEIQYFDGPIKTDKFVKLLENKKVRYVIIRDAQNIYEVHYNFRAK